MKKPYSDSIEEELIGSKTETENNALTLSSSTRGPGNNFVSEIRDLMLSVRKSVRASAESFSRSTYFLKNRFYTNKYIDLFKEVNIMACDLNDEEKEILKHVLEYYLGELREEVVKTEASQWKPPLHIEEEKIKKLITKFS
jgi:hypothetical protein